MATDEYAAGRDAGSCKPDRVFVTGPRLEGVTTPQREPGFEDLRCSDSDRQLVTDVLNTAYAEGRITIDEHDERVDKAHAAKTFRELNALTTDLIAGPAVNPPGSRPGQSLTPRAPQPGAPAPVEFTGGSGIMSSIKPTLPIRFPEEVTVTSVLGEVKLDLVGATFAASTVRLRVQACLADVRVRVPEGVNVIDNITHSLSESKLRGLVPETGSITVVLEGWSVLSEVQVLGPDTKPKKYEKFIR